MDRDMRWRRELEKARFQEQALRELATKNSQHSAARLVVLATELEHLESAFAQTVQRMRSKKAFRLALLLDRIGRRFRRGSRSLTPTYAGMAGAQIDLPSPSLLADEVVRTISSGWKDRAAIVPDGGIVGAVQISTELVKINEFEWAGHVAEMLFWSYPGVVTPEWAASFLSELRSRAVTEPGRVFVSAALRRWPDHAWVRFEVAAFSDMAGGVGERIANWEKVLDAVSDFDIPTIRTTAELALEALQAEPEATSWRTLDPVNPLQYREWIRLNENHSPQAFDQWSAATGSTQQGPTFVIVMPIENPAIEFLRQAIESVQQQWYARWELVMCDNESQNAWFADAEIGRLLKDQRIRVENGESYQQHGGISRAINAGFNASQGEWAVFMGQADLLSPDALAHVVDEILGEPRARLVYSDEDSVDADGTRLMPHFKPRVVRELLLGQDVVGHLSVFRRDLIVEVGGLRNDLGWIPSWDLALRAFEVLEDHEILHVSRILYHKRSTPETTPSTGAQMGIAYGAGLSTVRAAVQRRGFRAEIRPVSRGDWFQVAMRPISPAPLASIIIPTRDHPEILVPCITSLLSATQYAAFEVIIMDNGTRDEAAQKFLKSVGKRSDVTIVSWDKRFNFSELLNEGVRRARGEIVVSLNNDVIVHQEDWLTQFAAHLQRDDVGAVGARLLYADRRVQHGGVSIGLGGVAGHSFCGLEATDSGYFGQALLNREVEAVTAAAMGVRRKVFMAHGGFDEKNLPIAFNDVDFCLRLRKAGLTNIQLASVELTHLESSSRGSDFRPERREAFAQEINYMKRTWGRDHGDLFDSIRNPNFAQRVGDRLLAAPLPEAY